MAVTGEFVHIWSNDPAVDTKHAKYDFEKWLSTGDDKYLPIKSGCTPTTYKLRALNRQECWYVKDQYSAKGMHSMLYDCVAMSLVGMSPHKSPEGKDKEFNFVMSDGFRKVDPEDMADPPEDALYEMGQRVLGIISGN